jgi:L,D-transpeptidase ErfK/SrfK
MLLFAGTAAAVSAPPPASDLIGQVAVFTTRHEDTLLDVARNHQLGLIEVMAANPGTDPWLPGEGTRVILPTAHILPEGRRTGIVINLTELRLYYFRNDGSVVTLPIGVGREGFATPVGRTTIVRKQKDPSWYPTASTRADNPDLPPVVPPGDDNPLGAYAMYLGWPAYLMHGTNMPWGVGRRVSRGCIRLYPESIEWLFAQVPVGTSVTTVQQDVKLGRHAGDLFIEVTPTPAQVDQIEEKGFAEPAGAPELVDPDRILEAADKDISRLDWNAITWALHQREGIPIRITR